MQCSSTVVQQCTSLLLIVDANDLVTQAARMGGSASCASCASKATVSPGAIVEFTGGSLKQGSR